VNQPALATATRRSPGRPCGRCGGLAALSCRASPACRACPRRPCTTLYITFPLFVFEGTSSALASLAPARAHRARRLEHASPRAASLSASPGQRPTGPAP
jgi:hypothetical protein